MNPALITVAIPFRPELADAVARYLDAELGNPPRPGVKDALDAIGIVHFMSIVVVPAGAGEEAMLLVEITADDGEARALRRIVDALGEKLAGVLDAAGVARPPELVEFLRGHALTLGQSWWSTLGLPIPGTIGLTAARIRRERDLARRVAAILDAQPRGMSALQRLEDVRRILWNAGDVKWAFEPEPAPCLAGAPDSGLTPLVKPFFGETIGDRPFDLLPALATLSRLAVSAFTTMLWPIAAFFAALIVAMWYVAGPVAAIALTAAILVLLPPGAAAAAFLGYRALRRHETRDEPVDREPAKEPTAEIMRHETHSAQNLLFACSPLKPGLFRRLVLRFAMWSVGTVPLFCRPGFLGPNRMIHFARWLVAPGTNQLVFMSNYDGTWTGYVGDFVQNAAGAHGVTSLWSNCEGFPRTRDLVVGADDRDRLLRWARRQQRPVYFWYSGYPDVTTDRFRTNAAIRQGIASAQTVQDAEDWLACFGSAPRPPDSMQVEEVPALAMSGLGAYRHASRLAVSFEGDAAACGAWLATLEADVAWGEAAEAPATLVIGLAASALAKLGIEGEDLATFPVAYQEGMATAHRARALGDVAAQAPPTWDWGGPNNAPVDALVLLYAKDAGGLAAIEARVLEATAACGHAAAPVQPLAPLAENRKAREAFGFVDGVSQPRIRGTRRAHGRGVAANDLVAPGELVLGYPDNLGRLPPTPSVAARMDPAHLLADVGPDPWRQRPESARPGASGRRDLGRNGCYLVVRQLDQYVDRFNAWLDEATRATEGSSLPPDPTLRRQAIAARMVGRWQNGTSLVRYPERPGTRRDEATRRTHDQPPDNDFMYGAEDPSGTRCPFGAHIRRANPRDGLAPGSPERLAIVNSHRMLRVGRSYEPEGGMRGLLFMCVNADIERQFEFVQEIWLQNPSFAGLEHETDPLLGNESPPRCFTAGTGDGPLRLSGLSEFVRMRGGGYFFLPGRAAYRFLATLPSHAPGASVA